MAPGSSSRGSPFIGPFHPLADRQTNNDCTGPAADRRRSLPDRFVISLGEFLVRSAGRSPFYFGEPVVRQARHYLVYRKRVPLPAANWFGTSHVMGFQAPVGAERRSR